MYHGIRRGNGLICDKIYLTADIPGGGGGGMFSGWVPVNVPLK